MAQILFDRLFGFVGLGPADRRFISRMHSRDLEVHLVPNLPTYSYPVLSLGLKATST